MSREDQASYYIDQAETLRNMADVMEAGGLLIAAADLLEMAAKLLEQADALEQAEHQTSKGHYRPFSMP